MRRRQVMTVTAVALALVLGVVVQAGEVEDEAVQTAKQWLALVDAGDFEASWTEAAEYFRNAVTRQDWVRTIEAVRQPLGDVVSRELRSAEFTTTLPGAPDGEYVVVQFATEFDNKTSAVETVTPMRDPDGAWRVSGYFIK